jgi:hypothetical protein
VIELYAITEHPGPPLPDIAPLRAVPHGRLAAVCGPVQAEEVTTDALWRHEEVVEALLEDRALLPVRFGTRLADEEEAARAIAEREEAFEAALERVRGAVELSLRVHASDRPSSPCDESGREYIIATARLEGAREAVLQTVHETLVPLAREAVTRAPGGDGELMRAAYLVDNAGVEGFAERVRRIQDDRPDLQLLCTGPWPPYSFVEQ